MRVPGRADDVQRRCHLFHDLLRKGNQTSASVARLHVVQNSMARFNVGQCMWNVVSLWKFVNLPCRLSCSALDWNNAIYIYILLTGVTLWLAQAYFHGYTLVVRNPWLFGSASQCCPKTWVAYEQWTRKGLNTSDTYFWSWWSVFSRG
jgi:hypothetical protein